MLNKLPNTPQPPQGATHVAKALLGKATIPGGKRLALLFSVLLLAVARKSSKNLPEGAPAPIKQKALVERMLVAENDFQSIRISGNANYSKGSTSQSFKLEVRILTDSLVWVDIADPLLGIKVARAVVYKDSVAFINRLEKQYFVGRVADLQSKLKLNFGFEQIQAILSGNLLFDLDKDFGLYYKPGAYLLSDFDPDPKGDQPVTGNLSKTEFRQIYVEPASYKPQMQVQQEPAMGKNSTITYKDVKKWETGTLYPQTLKIERLENGEELQLIFDVKRVDQNDPQLNYPFNIPSDYAEMR